MASADEERERRRLNRELQKLQMEIERKAEESNRLSVMLQEQRNLPHDRQRLIACDADREEIEKGRDGDLSCLDRQIRSRDSAGIDAELQRLEVEIESRDEVHSRMQAGKERQLSKNDIDYDKKEELQSNKADGQSKLSAYRSASPQSKRDYDSLWEMVPRATEVDRLDRRNLGHSTPNYSDEKVIGRLEAESKLKQCSFSQEEFGNELQGKVSDRREPLKDMVYDRTVRGRTVERRGEYERSLPLQERDAVTKYAYDRRDSIHSIYDRQTGESRHMQLQRKEVALKDLEDELLQRELALREREVEITLQEQRIKDIEEERESSRWIEDRQREMERRRKDLELRDKALRERELAMQERLANIDRQPRITSSNGEEWRGRKFEFPSLDAKVNLFSKTLDTETHTKNKPDDASQTGANVAEKAFSPKFSTFSGEEPKPRNEVTYEEWRYEVECMKEENIIPEYLLSQGIRRSLKGQAKRVLLPLGTSATVTEILKKLEGVFGNVATGESILQEFYTAQQKPGEAVVAWGLRLEEILMRAESKGNLQEENRNKMLKTKFWRGLHSSELRNATRIYHENIDDFETLRRKVRAEEYEMTSGEIRESLSTERKRVQQQALYNDQQLKLLQDLVKRMENLEKSVEAMKASKAETRERVWSRRGGRSKQMHELENSSKEQPKPVPEQKDPLKTI